MGRFLTFIPTDRTTSNGDLGSRAAINCVGNKQIRSWEGIGPAWKASGWIVPDVHAKPGVQNFASPEALGGSGSSSELVEACRSRLDADFGFRQFKNLHFVSFPPLHHWRVHSIHILTPPASWSCGPST